MAVAKSLPYNSPRFPVIIVFCGLLERRKVTGAESVF